MSDMSEMNRLMREAFALKARIDADKRRLAEIYSELAAAAEFRDGSKTARVAGQEYLVKVQQRETVTWDQNALREAVRVMGVEEFRKAFTFEYKPISSQSLKNWMADPSTSDESRRLISAARQVKMGSPSVSVEYVGSPDEGGE